MYIRAKEKRNPNSSKVYYTHKLVESVRTEQGPRQKTLLNLGTLDLEQKHWKPLANRIEELLRVNSDLLHYLKYRSAGLALCKIAGAKKDVRKQ
ncbi:MAG: hypothetical protein U5R49_12725 [Deltaproteobacteria bacterium]|nr:hypothetical protein [Deltaproteobacteria bacterium]